MRGGVLTIILIIVTLLMMSLVSADDGSGSNSNNNNNNNSNSESSGSSSGGSESSSSSGENPQAPYLNIYISKYSQSNESIDGVACGSSLVQACTSMQDALVSYYTTLANRSETTETLYCKFVMDPSFPYLSSNTKNSLNIIANQSLTLLLTVNRDTDSTNRQVTINLQSSSQFITIQDDNNNNNDNNYIINIKLESITFINGNNSNSNGVVNMYTNSSSSSTSGSSMSLSMVSCQFLNNANSALVNISGPSTGLEMSNCLFVNNTNVDGVSLISFSGGEINMQDCYLHENAVSMVTNTTSVISVTGNTMLDINSCNFFGNSAGMAIVSVSGQPAGGYVNIVDTDFSDNQVTSSGATVFVANTNSPITVLGSTFTNGVGGSAVRVEVSNATIDLTSNTFQSQKGADFGGGVHLYECGQHVHIAESTFTNNQAMFGGAISFYQVYNSSIINVTMTNNTAVSGGAIFADNDNEMDDNNDNLSLSPSTLGLVAASNSSGNHSKNYDREYFILMITVVFDENQASKTGACIYCESGTTIDIFNFTSTNNTVDNKDSQILVFCETESERDSKFGPSTRIISPGSHSHSDSGSDSDNEDDDNGCVVYLDVNVNMLTTFIPQCANPEMPELKDSKWTLSKIVGLLFGVGLGVLLIGSIILIIYKRQPIIERRAQYTKL
ncbi:hypothetical protein DFA_12285 [Cavenderia fasciculata]|uniref:Right handed beta helix domain-containing protein n=1 Tax=Cavenderia fasciculata TaxID=261658 RepID=F4QCY5_CACFS|nr:uncharacterized protein DFA_12285 [Cavenderia fasciculata]EGG14509.1 hypothetical protein DFA_12285 [Cavenderia fasciculata]|eukprot:XP_004353921.1 hypothetical protein DFA_12285 [Cavenderia fasciculata]